MDGTVISFDSNKEAYVNPMDVDFEGVDYGRLREIISDKADFILSLLSSCLKRDMLPEEQGIVDSVIEKVYSENYSMRKRLNGISEEESEFSVPGYMRSDAVTLAAETDMSNEEQIRAYSPTLQDVYQVFIKDDATYSVTKHDGTTKEMKGSDIAKSVTDSAKEAISKVAGRGR